MENLELMGAKDRVRLVHRMQGFTLVEMAVVLVIIGVILSAVMVGRDVQRNSEYVKIRQTFVNQWAVAYNTYYQRMGGPFNDDPSTPQLMVNGKNFAIGGKPDAICKGVANTKMGRSAQGNADLLTLMVEAGLELPRGRGPGKEDRYLYTDSNGNKQELQICFQWNPPATASGTGNVMVIAGLTPDLARALAQGIKGAADGKTGIFRRGDDGNLGKEWGTNVTAAEGDIVDTVVAHYQMSQ